MEIHEEEEKRKGGEERRGEYRKGEGSVYGEMCSKLLHAPNGNPILPPNHVLTHVAAPCPG